MRLAAISPVYNEESLIKGCIESLRPFVEEHIVLVSEKPYYSDPWPKDRTAEIAEELGATVINGNWELDNFQRNTGIALLQDYDWILTTDVDMWMLHEDVEKLIKKLEVSKSEALVIKQIAYWKDIDHVLVDDDFMPVIAIRPSVKFTHIGCVDKQCQIVDDINIHHINWCEPKNILKKVLTYSHAPEFSGQKWYDEFYLGWKEGMDAILPNKAFKVKNFSLPEELRRYL